jgi:GNAT superfamily N-acetyltransferase
MSISIRPLEKNDISEVMEMIKELAEYEKMEDMLNVSPDFIEQEILPPNTSFECLVAVDQNTEKLVGYAALYRSMSLFLGANGFHLHDLYVREQARRSGVGLAFFKEIASIAEKRGYKRFSWEVLKWNDIALNFYHKLGAYHEKDWDVFKLEGENIARISKLDLND